MKKVKPVMPVAILLIALAIGGCSTPKEFQLPAATVAPGTFEGHPADTANSIGELPLRVFFKDPHLLNLLDTALKNNSDALVALQRMRIAEAQLTMAKRAWLPSLDAAISGGLNKYGDYTMDGVGNFDTNLSPNINKDQRIPSPVPDYFAGLRSSWEIDLWGKLKNKKQAAVARYLSSSQGVRLINTQLVAKVAGMYYQLMELDYEWNVIQKNIALQEAAIVTVQVQQEAGRANSLAVQQFTAQLLNTKSLAFGVQQERVQLENQLNTLLGRFPQPVARSGSLLEATLDSTLQTGIPASMLQRRPDVQQASFELQAAKADVKAAKAAFLPSLNLTASVGYNAFNAGLLFQSPASIAYGLLGGITAPVFNKKQLKAQYNISTAEGTAAFYNYRQAIVNGYQEVITALHSVSNAQGSFALKEKEVLVLKDAVSISRDLYTTGFANYLEVINAQKSVLEAEIALARHKKDVFLGTIELYRALGGGAL